MNERPPIPPAPQILLRVTPTAGRELRLQRCCGAYSLSRRTSVSAVSRELHALDPEIPLGEISTMERHLADQTADSRFTTVLLSILFLL